MFHLLRVGLLTRAARKRENGAATVRESGSNKRGPGTCCAQASGLEKDWLLFRRWPAL